MILMICEMSLFMKYTCFIDSVDLIHWQNKQYTILQQRKEVTFGYFKKISTAIYTQRINLLLNNDLYDDNYLFIELLTLMNFIIKKQKIW